MIYYVKFIPFVCRFKIDLTQLRRKFEDDKKRIATMRAARKFKPY